MSVPPNSIEAEQAVLGSMMLEKTCIPAVCTIVQAKDFYRPVHQQIFNVVEKLYNDGVFIDLISAQEELKSQGILDEIGGTEYLFALVESVPTAANHEHYARIVKTHSLKRQHLMLGNQLIEAASKPDADPQHIAEVMVAELSKINATQKQGETSFKKYFSAFWERFFAKEEESESNKIWKTGIPTLDNMTGKIGDAYLMLLKGLSGSGKTHALIHFAMKCAEAGRTAVIFSYEMSQDQITERIVAYITSTDSHELVKVSDVSTAAMKSAVLLKDNYEIEVFEGGEHSVASIRMACHALINNGADIGFIGVDYIELVRGREAYNREQELAIIMKDFKKLSNELKTTVMVLSQINEDGTERGSRAIGHLADLNMQWFADAEDSTKGRFYSAKSRFGKKFNIKCGIDPRTSNFWELTDQRGFD